VPEFLYNISRAGWSHNTPGGSAIDRTDIECPYFPGQPVYESACTDGQRASFDPPENRRNDIQRGSLPAGFYCVDFAWRYLNIPTFASGEWGWNLVGPEVHDNENQSPIQPQVLPSSGTGSQGTTTPRRNPDLPEGEPRYFMDANASRGPHRYFDLGPAPREWEVFRLLFHYTDSSSGRLLVYRGDNAELVLDLLDQTAISPAGWWKVANYAREALVNGLSLFQMAGRIYRCASLDDVPPYPTLAGEPEPEPEPEPTPTPEPTMNISISTDDFGQFTVTLDDPDGLVTEVIVGVSGDPVPVQVHPAAPTITGSFDTAPLTAGQQYWSWAVARNAAGATVGQDPDGDPFTPTGDPTPAPEPEPEPEPTPACEDALAAMTAERDALQAKIDAAKAALA
jgi:hypothetical protein